MFMLLGLLIPHWVAGVFFWRISFARCLSHKSGMISTGMAHSVTFLIPRPPPNDPDGLGLPVPPIEVAPRVGAPITLMSVTTEEIIKALQTPAAPRPPSPILSEEEWIEK